MSSHQKVFSLVNPLRKKSAASDIRVDALHQATMRLADLHNGRSRLKAKDLVSLLLCHGARISRASAPRARISIKVLTPVRNAAVKIRLQ